MATVTQAVDLVGQARLAGQIARFTGDADFADLVSGAMAIAQVRSGDVAGLVAANPALQFVVPVAGSTVFARDMVIPDTTHNQVAAESWMNWIYDRSHYASLIAAVRATVVLSDMDAELTRLDPALAADPLVNPPRRRVGPTGDVGRVRPTRRGPLRRPLPPGDRLTTASRTSDS